MPLTSRHNPLLKTVRQAVVAGRATPDGQIAAEGPHLLEEALRSPWRPEQIFATASALSRYEHLIAKSRVEIFEVSDGAFESIASTEHGQGILTLLRPRIWRFGELRELENPLLLVLDGLQDPGNAGTVVRSAEAFGATGVLLGRGSVRISNPKFLRATAGSIFRVPYLEQTDIADIAGLPAYSLCADARLEIADVDLRQGAVLVTGSEGQGVSAAYREASIAVRIPAFRVESLNAAAACSIALYEASRQRGHP